MCITENWKHLQFFSKNISQEPGQEFLVYLTDSYEFLSA